MNEKFEVYDLEDNLVRVEERKTYEKSITAEFLETGAISTKVRSVRMMLMTSNGRIYMQKRSRIKSTNPGLLDKTVGGHVSAGHSDELTVVKECAEELGIPAAVLDKKSFTKISPESFQVIAVVNKVETISDFISRREIGNDKFIEQPYIAEMYLGYYDGPIRFVDGESCGIESFSMSELEQEMENHPSLFTQDALYMANRYKNLLVPFTQVKKGRL